MNPRLLALLRALLQKAPAMTESLPQARRLGNIDALRKFPTPSVPKTAAESFDLPAMLGSDYSLPTDPRMARLRGQAPKQPSELEPEDLLRRLMQNLYGAAPEAK